MRYCMEICRIIESAICCAGCDADGCEARCKGVEYGKEKVNCRMLDEKSQEDENAPLTLEGIKK